MWKVWIGNVFGASIALNCFYGGVDIHIMICEEDSSRSTRLEQVCERLAELWSYLIANQTRLINYGREYCKGQFILQARGEAALDQVVDWGEGEKNNSCWARWRPREFHPRRSADINGRPGQ